METFKVIIVGGGLSGALLANGLSRNDVRVKLYERDEMNSKREGYQIRIGEPSFLGFKACLDESQISTILEKFGKSSGSSSTAPTIYTTKFKPVLDLTKLPSYSRSWAINRVVLRNLILEPVKIQGHVHFQKTFSHYDIVQNSAGEEKVCVHFLDGSSDLSDVLIGADGSASKVNNQVGLKNLVHIDTHWSFLCKGSLPSSRIEKLPGQLQKGPILVFAKGATLFYALYLPARRDASSAEDASISYDEEAASFYWAFNIPKWFFRYNEPSETPDRQQLILDFVRDWAPEFHNMLSIGFDDKDAGQIYVTQLRASRKPSKTWREDLERVKQVAPTSGHPRIWLVGDAVHAMQPNRGMGGNQAMQDCAEILPPLLQLDAISKNGSSPSTTQVRTALAQCENTMIDRSFSWVRKSGGSSVLQIDFDGLLGIVVFIVGIIVIPVLKVLYRVFPKKRNPGFLGSLEQLRGRSEKNSCLR